MPHVKLDATPKFKGKSKGGLYGDVVEEIDYNVGRIIDYLKKENLAKNTYIIFTSDNGPLYMEKSKTHRKRGEANHGGSASPLRGYKVNTWEGGYRVPCIVWRPGTVQSSSKSDEIFRTIDFLPTFAALAGAKTPQDRIIDGVEAIDLLHGKDGAKSPSDTYYYYAMTQLVAIRKGDWKLHLPLDKKVFKRWEIYTKDEDIIKLGKTQLFNLKEHISEQKNIAESHPEIVKELMH